MGKFLNRLYRHFESPGVLNVARNINLEFSWVIEAGCHDGQDTLKFASLPNVEEIFAFEPDRAAMAKARQRLRGHQEIVHFSDLALLDKTGFVSIYDHYGELGTGNTIFRFSDIYSENTIACSTLDIEIPAPKKMECSGWM